MSDTATQLLAIFQEAVPGLPLDPAADGDRPLSALGIDSLDKMTILLAVQERWNLEFTEAEIPELASFNAICRRLG